MSLPFTHAFCEMCNETVEIQPFEGLSTDELNPGKAWGDIVCAKCHGIIASVSVPTEGESK